MSNFDFTDRAQQSLAAAIQLAKDYATAQVQPAHLAFVLLNEGAGEAAQSAQNQHSLFSSIIQKAGGEPVSSLLFWPYIISYLHTICAATCEPSTPEADRPLPIPRPPAR